MHIDQSDPPEFPMQEKNNVDSRGFRPLAAATIASSTYLIPYLMSRSTSPTPDHPATWAWYRNLAKPAFNPPDRVFPIAWLAIESTLAWSGYRMLLRPSTRPRNISLALLAGNVVGIGAWGRLFFGSKNLPVSTVASAALCASATAYVAQSAKVDRRAAAAGIPFVAWVAFATVLTASVWRKNR
jgi:tryptophan-rich sensory protein